jgi:hypothetical protein
MTKHGAKPGDIFLLFGEFAYDFETDLPIGVGRGIYLDNTPHGVLSGAQPRALADYVLPGYNLNAGSSNSCLRYSSCVALPSNIEPPSLLFNSVIALRLVAPGAIRVEGRFTLGHDGRSVENPSLYHLTSPWQPKLGGYYSAREVRFAAGIARRLVCLLGGDYGRIATAIVLFSQVTTGQVRSFQMAYLGLFSALEALFAPKSKKAEILADRADSFLATMGTPSGWSVRDWLSEEYQKGRSQLAHGIQDVIPWGAKLRPCNQEAFGRLHEITRLCMLGFISLPDGRLRSIGQASGTTLQNELKSLAPAGGRFLKHQRMWCD